MADLHEDAPVGLVHGLRDREVARNLIAAGQGARRLGEAPGGIRRHAAGDDEPGLAAGALGIKYGEARLAVRHLLEAGVHGAHDHPVGQGHKSEVKGGEQVGVGHRVFSFLIFVDFGAEVSGRRRRESTEKGTRHGHANALCYHDW